MKLYISGVVSLGGRLPEAEVRSNMEKFGSMKKWLHVEGHEPVNPVDKGIVEGWGWSDYLRYDLKLLCDCEGVVVLPGWDQPNAKGALLEVHVARELGMPIYEVRDAALVEVAAAARHPSSGRFHELLSTIGALHDRKQKDYGSAADPFANVRASQTWGVPAWVGALMRLNDKVVRLQRFARDGELANESARDSMLDIAVYALIAYVLYEEEEGRQTEVE